MSGALATPSTSMFIASFPTRQLIRLATNPGNSSTSTVSLPICSATLRATSTVSSVVSRPRTSSTSFILCAGLKKCMAIQRSGLLVAAAISVGLIVEVLVASTARSGHRSSSLPKISSFSSISSGTAPMTDTLPTSTRLSSPLPEGRHAGQGVAQNQGVHLVRTLVGQHALQVVGVAYHGIVERDAVPAQNGARLPRYLYGLPNVVQLADGDVFGAQGSLVLHPSDVQREQRAFVDLQRHVHELLLRELEASDRLAKLLAPL